MRAHHCVLREVEVPTRNSYSTEETDRFDITGVIVDELKSVLCFDKVEVSRCERHACTFQK
jgi:hypothetical protein